jgi:hypothetical protein
MIFCIIKAPAGTARNATAMPANIQQMKFEVHAKQRATESWKGL